MEIKKRIRITKQEIQRAREELQQAKPKAQRQTVVETPKLPQAGWYGIVYCDSYGECWITHFKNGKTKTICLGKKDEVLEVLKRADTENVGEVLKAIKAFRQEKENCICHSDTKNERGGMLIPPAKVISGIFLRDPVSCAS